MVTKRSHILLLCSTTPHCLSAVRYLLHEPFTCQCCPHVETSQLICTANQLSGFYMRATFAFNGLKIITFGGVLFSTTSDTWMTFSYENRNSSFSLFRFSQTYVIEKYNIHSLNLLNFFYVVVFDVKAALENAN